MTGFAHRRPGAAPFRAPWHPRRGSSLDAKPESFSPRGGGTTPRSRTMTSACAGRTYAPPVHEALKWFGHTPTSMQFYYSPSRPRTARRREGKTETEQWS